MDRCLAGETLSFETARAVSDGSRRVLEAMYSPCRDSEGSVYAVAATIRDVTELRSAEEALASSAEFLLETGRMARVGGWSLVPAEDKLVWTEVTREIHEVGQDYQPSLDTAVEFYHEQDRPQLAAAVQAALERGEPYDLEVRFITAKGRRLWVHTNCRPVMEDGRVVRLMGTLQDITQRKQAEELVLARMRLMEYGAELPREKFLQKSLDEICGLTESPIGFFHFLLPDQKTLDLRTWSTRTTEEFCTAEGMGAHCNLDQAGLWADCLRRREPVIHNDYALPAPAQGPALRPRRGP